MFADAKRTSCHGADDDDAVRYRDAGAAMPRQRQYASLRDLHRRGERPSRVVRRGRINRVARTERQRDLCAVGSHLRRVRRRAHGDRDGGGLRGDRLRTRRQRDGG